MNNHAFGSLHVTLPVCFTGKCYCSLAVVLINKPSYTALILEVFSVARWVRAPIISYVSINSLLCSLDMVTVMCSLI